MRRREFITLVGSVAATWPHAARAQQPDRVRLVGVLANGIAEDPEMKKWLAGLRDGLAKLGWSEGRTVRIEFRFTAAQADQYRLLAKELVALQPDVIVAQGTAAATALQHETHVIPIVFLQVSDPIGPGLVASLARPGGNLTGLMLYEEGITGKWLGMLKEIAPGLKHAALVANPKTTPFDYFLRNAEAAAPALAMEITPTPIDNTVDSIKRSIDSFAQVPNGGLLLVPDGTTIVNRDLVIALAAGHRLPAVYPWRYFVTAGGLMSYGIDVVDAYEQAGSYVDRILRGAKPSDLPVEAPTKYETAVNLKTAKAIGLDVPPSLLVRADEVIE